MADIKISDMIDGVTAEGTDWIEISRAGTPRLSRRIALADLTKVQKDVACSDENSILSTGLKVTFRWKQRPIATGLKISASLTTAQASGATLVTVDVRKNAVTMFSTKVTIDNTEKTSETAAIPAVLSVTSIAYDDEITVYLDAIQAGSVAAGL
jgi:hypothetical protein